VHMRLLSHALGQTARVAGSLRDMQTHAIEQPEGKPRNLEFAGIWALGSFVENTSLATRVTCQRHSVRIHLYTLNIRQCFRMK